jgi:hypothetical protein
MKIMKTRYILLSTGLALLLFSCNTTRLIKPLPVKETRVSLDAGGPIIGTPLPLSSICVAHGLRENLSLFAGMQLTNLAFNTLQMDLGLSYGLMAPDGYRPGWNLNLILNPMTEGRAEGFDLFPESTFTGYWDIKGKHFPYLGFTAWYDFGAAKAELNKGQFFHPTLLAGYNYEANNWVFGLEGKWLQFDQQLHIPQVDIANINGNGSIGVYLKVAYRLHKKSEE